MIQIICNGTVLYLPMSRSLQAMYSTLTKISNYTADCISVVNIFVVNTFT